MRWILTGSGQVEYTAGILPCAARGEFWEGQITEERNPHVYTTSVDIDADTFKYLYIECDIGNGDAVRVCFSPDRQLPPAEGTDVFVAERSFRAASLSGRSPVLLVFDLSGAWLWRGRIRLLRLHFHGLQKGEIVRLFRIGVSESHEAGDNERTILSRIAQNPDFQTVRCERMAAYHETIIAMDNERPNAEVITWASPSRNTFHMVSKLTPYLDIDGRLAGPDEARDVKVWDFPGGVEASYRIGTVGVKIRFIPLLFGRNTVDHDGAALFQISTEPAIPAMVFCGGGREFSFFDTDSYLKHERFTPGKGALSIQDDIALMTHDGHPYTVAARSSGMMSADDGGGSQKLCVRFDCGAGSIALAFAPDRERAGTIMREIEPETESRKVQRYYSELLQSSVTTPDQNMDRAFTSALYNLEYHWLKPYGWVETIHTYIQMYHQQHIAAADWLDQHDRSRECLLSTANFITEDGAVRAVQPDGSLMMAFGGDSQYFTWAVSHFWKHTADREFAAAIAPLLDTVIRQVYAEHDADGNLLLGWGSQIGNQEDYTIHPNDSTSPSIEGINMMRTRLMLGRALGDGEAELRYAAMIDAARDRLKKSLWKQDLGRFVFYRDAVGKVHLDGQYHTFIYPVIYDISDPLDAWTSMRHLRDRLTGEAGEVYLNNNFPCHGWGAWCLATLQPWAAKGIGAVGLNNETFIPLKRMAEWTAEKGGSWPEGSGGTRPDYFSPTAGVYIMGVVEALFGLSMSKPEGYLYVSPSFPDSWPEAELKLPGVEASFSRQGKTTTYKIKTRELLKR
jgi:hypothetical protein